MNSMAECSIYISAIAVTAEMAHDCENVMQ